MISLPKRYSLKSKSFDGGMSNAVLCLDNHLEREVIVKALIPGIPKKRLSEEIAALLKIRSRHVVQIYDVILDGDGAIVAIVQEYLPGRDLTNQAPPANELEFLKIVYPIASGLRDIHEAGIIHRDIKRNNIKYDGEGYLKIFDFGLAKNTTTAATIGELGTKGYMAPELFPTGGTGSVSFTQAVDVYAFGALCLRLLIKFPKDFSSTPPVVPCAEADFSRFGFSSDIADCLNSCISPIVEERPTARDVQDLVGRHLTRDKHRVTLMLSKTLYIIDKNTRSAVLSSRNGSSAVVNYDGINISVSRRSGHVEVNNIGVSGSRNLPGSCVITLGSPDLGTARDFITVDISHPEPQV